MYYIVSEWIDCSDEFEYPIISILNEEEYKKYKFLQKKFEDDSLTIEFYFGTYEGWDAFNPFDFAPKPISEEKYNILQSYIRTTCNLLELGIIAILEKIYEDDIKQEVITQTTQILMQMSFCDFKEEINKLSNNE